MLYKISKKLHNVELLVIFIVSCEIVYFIPKKLKVTLLVSVELSLITFLLLIRFIV